MAEITTTDNKFDEVKRTYRGGRATHTHTHTKLREINSTIQWNYCENVYFIALQFVVDLWCRKMMTKHHFSQWAYTL